MRMRRNGTGHRSGLSVISAIGKEGQNAKLAARLTTYKIDIKSETQAREMGLFDALESGEYEDGFEGEFETEGSYEVPAEEDYQEESEE